MSTATKTKVRPEAAPAIDVDDLLGGMAAAKPKGKVAKPVVKSNETIDQLLEEYFKYSEDAKSAKELADIRRDDVVALARPMFYEACAKAGKSLGSIVIGKGSISVKNQYSPVELTEKDSLVEAFGDDYALYFRLNTELTIKKDSSNEPGLVKELIDRLGVDFFRLHFDVKRNILVNGALHDALNTNSALRDVAQPFIDCKVIKPYSPAIVRA